MIVYKDKISGKQHTWTLYPGLNPFIKERWTVPL